MTVVTTKDPRDISAINKAKEFNTRLLCGDKYPQHSKEFLEQLENKLLSVNVIAANESTFSVNSSTPGSCQPLPNGESRITMRGFKNCSYTNYQFTIHEFIHEYWHAILNAGSFITGDSKYSRNHIGQDGKLYKKVNGDGVVQIIDPVTNEVKKEYGLMFLETSADIFTTLSLMAFEPMFPREGVNVDTVFEKHFNEWGDSPTGYSVFTTLTRLLIAAFSNNGYISYQDLVNEGYSVFYSKVKNDNGTTAYLNDYLYGIVSDPLHIEKSYDKFMGKGSYEQLCTLMDSVFREYSNTRTFTPKMRLQIKKFIITVADFSNKKLGWELQSGIININTKNSIVSKFNRIWNTIAYEYGFNVTQEDLNEIYKRAHEEAVLHIF